jgi:glycine/D-amino acid oxidase-like deaminating enzyme
MPPQHLLVIGGGIQGSSVAFHFSKQNSSPSSRVTIVEANATLAPHASGKGGGFLARSWGDGGVTEGLHHLSFDMHEELASDLSLTSYRKIPCLGVGSSSSKKSKFNQKNAPPGVILPKWLDGEGGGSPLDGRGWGNRASHASGID